MDNEAQGLVERLRTAAKNISNARKHGLTEFMAGWEHNACTEAADTILRLRAELAAAKADRAGIVAWVKAWQPIEFNACCDPPGYFLGCPQRCRSHDVEIADAIESGADRKDG